MTASRATSKDLIVVPTDESLNDAIDFPALIRDIDGCEVVRGDLTFMFLVRYESNAVQALTDYLRPYAVIDEDFTTVFQEQEIHP